MNKTLIDRRSVAQGADVYIKLVRAFPLRPIRDEAEYRKASRVMMKLALKGEQNLTSGERDYLDAITVFVSRYDDQHYPIQSGGTPLERLKWLMKGNGMKAIDLGELVGGRAQASLILNAKRELSKANIRALAEHFRVSPALFI
jgi:HTH-type transcriptional regulator / antitoxin HigA